MNESILSDFCSSKGLWESTFLELEVLVYFYLLVWKKASSSSESLIGSNVTTFKNIQSSKPIVKKIPKNNIISANIPSNLYIQISTNGGPKARDNICFKEKYLEYEEIVDC